MLLIKSNQTSNSLETKLLQETLERPPDDTTAQKAEPILLAANGAADVATASIPKAIGTVTQTVAGPVTAISSDGTPRAINQGDSVYLHDTIVTGANSHIKITLNDGTLFQLGTHSRASLDKYTYDPENDAGSGGGFETFVYSGAFRYISGKISGDNQGQHTLIKTPSALIGIRGSEIDGKVEADGSTTVLHLSGLVSVTSRHHLGEVIVYERGTSVFIPSEALPPSINQLAPDSIDPTREQFLPLNLERGWGDSVPPPINAPEVKPTSRENAPEQREDSPREEQSARTEQPAPHDGPPEPNDERNGPRDERPEPNDERNGPRDERPEPNDDPNGVHAMSGPNPMMTQMAHAMSGPNPMMTQMAHAMSGPNPMMTQMDNTTARTN